MADEDVFEINDYSTSSDWERFVADLEEILTQWNLGGANDDPSAADDDCGGGGGAHGPNTDQIHACKVQAASSSKLFSDARLWTQKQDQLKFGKVAFTLTCFTFNNNAKAKE